MHILRRLGRVAAVALLLTLTACFTNQTLPDTSLSLSADDLTAEQQAFYDAIISFTFGEAASAYTEVLAQLSANPNMSEQEKNTLALQAVNQLSRSEIQTQNWFSERLPLNSIELGYILDEVSSNNFFFVLEFEGIRSFAEEQATDRYDDEARAELLDFPGLEDAFRHTYWNMALAYLYGSETAEKWASAHECYLEGANSTDTECAESEWGVQATDENGVPLTGDRLAQFWQWINMDISMDLNNNAIGREIIFTQCGDLSPRATPGELGDCLQDFMENSEELTGLVTAVIEGELNPAFLDEPTVECHDIYVRSKGSQRICLIPIEFHPDYIALVGGGGGGGNPNPAEPDISELSSDSIEFLTLVENAASNSFTFSNEGGLELNYSTAKAKRNSRWLSIQNGSGTLSPNQTATVNLQSSCPYGSLFKENVTVSSDDPNEPTKELGVKLRCVDPETDIGLFRWLGGGGGSIKGLPGGGSECWGDRFVKYEVRLHKQPSVNLVDEAADTIIDAEFRIEKSYKPGPCEPQYESWNAHIQKELDKKTKKLVKEWSEDLVPGLDYGGSRRETRQERQANCTLGPGMGHNDRCAVVDMYIN